MKIISACDGSVSIDALDVVVVTRKHNRLRVVLKDGTRRWLTTALPEVHSLPLKLELVSWLSGPRKRNFDCSCRLSVLRRSPQMFMKLVERPAWRRWLAREFRGLATLLAAVPLLIAAMLDRQS